MNLKEPLSICADYGYDERLEEFAGIVESLLKVAAHKAFTDELTKWVDSVWSQVVEDSQPCPVPDCEEVEAKSGQCVDCD